MPLSEHEQRLLEQMERALYAEDPKFATSMRNPNHLAGDTKKIALGAVAFLAGMGLVNPIATAIALEPFGDRAGVASALLGFLQMACAALGTGLIGALPLSPAGAFAWITLVSVALATLAFARVLRSASPDGP